MSWLLGRPASENGILCPEDGGPGGADRHGRGPKVDYPLVAAASDATVVNGWLVRKLPMLFERAGLMDVRARGFFPLETHLQSFYASMADRCAEAAVKAGVVTESEGRAWLHAFHDQGAQGPIVAGRLHIFVWGRKPE